MERLKNYDLNRLAELAQADKEGRVVILPVAVGQTVYEVDRMTCREAIAAGVPEDTTRRRKYAKKRPLYFPLLIREKKMVKSLYPIFGKYVFATREEAEKVLEEMQK